MINLGYGSLTLLSYVRYIHPEIYRHAGLSCFIW